MDNPIEARPATLEDLKKLIISFNDAGIDYFLIGGYALFAHGYQRATTDIDFIFPTTEKVGILVKEALMSLPDGVASDIDPKWFIDGEAIRVADAFIVDLMFNACGETYETLSQFKDVAYIDDVPVRTITLDGLLLTKQTMREKDIADRNILKVAIARIESERIENESRVRPPRG